MFRSLVWSIPHPCSHITAPVVKLLIDFYVISCFFFFFFFFFLNVLYFRYSLSNFNNCCHLRCLELYSGSKPRWASWPIYMIPRRSVALHYGQIYMGGTTCRISSLLICSLCIWSLASISTELLWLRICNSSNQFENVDASIRFSSLSIISVRLLYIFMYIISPLKSRIKEKIETR